MVFLVDFAIQSSIFEADFFIDFFRTREDDYSSLAREISLSSQVEGVSLFMAAKKKAKKKK